MLQLILTIIIYLIIVIPVGVYLYHVAAGKRTLADPVFNRIDGAIYKISGINPNQGMNWKKYALCLLGTNAIMILIGYIILRIQSIGLFNPNGIGAMEETLSFNTIISFMTNTNLQHYSGESGLSYLSQMLVITFMMFVSASTGYAACIAFIRGLAGKTKDNVGNFFVDLVRVTTRVLLPFSIVGGLLLVWQGVPQNLTGNLVVDTIEGTKQAIAMGPVAALEIIKHLGTNGGGFIGANSTTPIENPTIISDLIELYSMMLLPGACVITFGKMVRDRKKAMAESSEVKVDLRKSLTARIYGREGRSIFLAMGIIFLIGLSLCFWSESQGNPALADAGLSPLDGCRGLGCNIVYNPIDPRNFIYNARADAVQNIVGDTGPVSGHKIIGRDGAKGQGMVISTAIAHDAHRAGIGENGEKLTKILGFPGFRKLVSEDEIGQAKDICFFLGDISDDADGKTWPGEGLTTD